MIPAILYGTVLVLKYLYSLLGCLLLPVPILDIPGLPPFPSYSKSQRFPLPYRTNHPSRNSAPFISSLSKSLPSVPYPNLHPSSPFLVECEQSPLACIILLHFQITHIRLHGTAYAPRHKTVRVSIHTYSTSP